MDIKRVCRLFVLFFFSLLLNMRCAQAGELHRWFGQLKQDNQLYYQPKNLFKLGGGVVVNAILANTSLDHDFADYYQDHIHSGFTDNVAKVAKPFGTLSTVAWAYAGAVGVSWMAHNTQWGGTLGRWTSASLQAIVVGEPSVLILQRVIGSDRPSRGPSNWHFMHTATGVSGHAFLGAIPFLTAAKMSSHWYSKAFFYTASTLPAWSRINDRKHYLSQAILGWWIADLSENVVFHVASKAVYAAPMAVDHGVGVSFTAAV